MHKTTLGIPRSCWLAGVERVLLTLWVGGLWVAGYVVTPALFATLDDRQLAGQLAGQVFSYINYIGLTAGGFLLISGLTRMGKTWRSWVLAVMLVLVIVGGFVLQPMLMELKTGGLVAGSEQATQFGRIHGLSSLLYLINSLLGLLLVGTGLRPPASRQSL
jgi:hypothetical protein